jgi:CPA2 family monovalent cation:H+ antiporter-2
MHTALPVLWDVIPLGGPAGPAASAPLLELGLLVATLALLGRLAARVGISPVPFYLLVGLAFGPRGVVPLAVSTAFVQTGAQIGVVLLLFTLGLQYTASEFLSSVRSAWRIGVADAALNLVPGIVGGLLLGWGPVAAVLLGGATYASSSGIAARLIDELGWLYHREMPIVLSVLVMEDLAMTAYLPLVAVLAAGQSPLVAAATVAIALVVVAGVLLLALRYRRVMSRLLTHGSEEVVLLSALGLVLLVAGLAERFHVSAAVGAFLVGIALTGPIADRLRALVSPLRSLFTAIFFVSFGLAVEPRALVAAAVPALALLAASGVTKLATGWWIARATGVVGRGRWRAGAILLARGEFSIVLAAFAGPAMGVVVGSGATAPVGAVVAAYVLLSAIAGPIAARVVDLAMAAATAAQPHRAPLSAESERVPF